MQSFELDYTIPSDNRELQQNTVSYQRFTNYTIPSDNRELQRNKHRGSSSRDYTIPSDNRELQQRVLVIDFDKIIPYQVITGNYNRQ